MRWLCVRWPWTRCRLWQAVAANQALAYEMPDSVFPLPASKARAAERRQKMQAAMRGTLDFDPYTALRLRMLRPALRKPGQVIAGHKVVRELAELMQSGAGAGDLSGDMTVVE